MIKDKFLYIAKVVRIIDGDTIVLNIDLGFKIWHEITVRLYGINAYELKSKNKNEKILAYEAKNWLIDNLLSQIVTLKTLKDKTGKYGRYLAIIYQEHLNINDMLVDLGYAVKYDM